MVYRCSAKPLDATRERTLRLARQPQICWLHMSQRLHMSPQGFQQLICALTPPAAASSGGVDRLYRRQCTTAWTMVGARAKHGRSKLGERTVAEVGDIAPPCLCMARGRRG